MPSPVAVPIELAESEREQLESWSRRHTSAQALALRARIVLSAAEGLNNTEVAARLAVKRDTVRKWRGRFVADRLDGLLDEPRPGRPRTLSDQQVDEVITKSLESTPLDATHWSTRSMAAEVGLTQSAVHRIWKAFGLQPHRQETWKLSKDPQFIDKIRDVVGLYLDPPERAVVLCVDEKSQIQALDRTAPILPMLPGTPERATHDYKRSGTSSLYVALDIANGKVIGSLHSRHRAIEFKKFLQTLDREVPRNLDVHLVLDNASTHKTPAVKRWLNAHPRFVLHFTPTSSSWLNLVELPVVSRRSRRAASGYASERETWRKDEMSDALLIPIAAVATGVVVIVVAVAVVLVVLFVTLSMRGRQRRGLKRRDETRQELAEAHERAARA
ncbi:MAG: IS630 family transposase, partial [Ilumatobacteraceae bacterium]